MATANVADGLGNRGDGDTKGEGDANKVSVGAHARTATHLESNQFSHKSISGFIQAKWNEMTNQDKEHRAKKFRNQGFDYIEDLALELLHSNVGDAINYASHVEMLEKNLQSNI